MLLASADTQARIEAIAIPIAILIILISAAAYFVLRLRKDSSSEPWELLQDRATEIAGASAASDPLVTFTFHTYSGLLVYFVQTPHAPTLPYGIAVEYLRELHKYNLRRCLILYAGSIYVPVLSFVSYWIQLRNLKKQMAKIQGSPN